MQSKKHALVIGGTGMLGNVCIALAYKGYVVSVIGRTQTKFQRLISESPVDSIFPVVVDDTLKMSQSVFRKIVITGKYF